MSIETWELMGYVVTVIGLPLAIVVFLLEQSKAPLVGFVFNGLSEDVDNWSCRGSYSDHDDLPHLAAAEAGAPAATLASAD